MVWREKVARALGNPYRCWWCQDASTAASISDGTVVDAVGSWWAIAANAVLSIRQLGDWARGTTRGSELEAALVITADDGSRSADGEAGSSDEGLHVGTNTNDSITIRIIK